MREYKNKRIYRISGSRGMCVFVYIVCGMLGYFFLAMTLGIGSEAGEHMGFSFIGLLFLPVLAFLVFICVSLTRSTNRGIHALSGEKITGRIERVRITGGKNPAVEIIYEYRNKRNEAVYGVTNVSYSYRKMIHEDMRIPLYSDGEYAYFKKDEFRYAIENPSYGEPRMESRRESEVRYKERRCEYCDSLISVGATYCESCGARILEF